MEGLIADFLQLALLANFYYWTGDGTLGYAYV